MCADQAPSRFAWHQLITDGYGMLGGWLVFAHVPDHFSLMGMGLIALSGVASGLLTLYEIRQKSRVH